MGGHPKSIPERWRHISATQDGPSTPSAPEHQRLGDLFERLLALPAERREDFVARACGNDPARRDELLSLLQAHERAADYFESLSAHLVRPALSAIAGPVGDAPASRAMEQLQADLGHAYRLERELGGAGMSRVFVAEDARLKRHVVVKVLPPELVPSVNAERFQQEIELAAQLQHPHIVPLLTADTVNGTLYYTMPFVAGESLRDRLAREGALPVDDVVRIWRDVLDALAHAHAKGVIHRDIKPGNILLSGRHALVTDFGIAVALETAGGRARATAPGAVIGTPAYMAPEQMTGTGVIDHRADLYAAGVVAYEMLAGHAAFASDATRGLVRAHLNSDPPPLARADAPEKLVALVRRCLAGDPAARASSADAILAELEPHPTTVADVHPTQNPPVRRAPPRIGRYVLATLALGAAVFLAVRLASTDPGPPTPPRAYTPALAAYEWYRRGMDVALLRSDSGRRKGVAYFQRALAIDSMYGAAHAGLARMYTQLAHVAPDGQRQEWEVLAQQASEKALALDDSLPEALAAMGWVRILNKRYQEAAVLMARAVAMDPSVPRGHEALARIYMMTGRPAEQLAAARRGVELDPYSHSALRELALALAMNHRCDEAIVLLRPLKRLAPPAGVAGVISGQCYASQEKWEEAIGEYRWAMQHSATAARAFLGHALARAGLQEEARQILSDLLAQREYSHGAFGIAIVHTGLRDYDQAFAWLERAVERNLVTAYIMEPMFADLHRDPRFDRLMRRIGATKP